MRKMIPTLALGLLLGLLLVAGPARAAGIDIYAAASLTDALRDVAVLWQKAGHALPHLSFAASSTLARQIDQGAPANVFASADEKWMDWAQQRNLIVPATRQDLLGNTLVLVVPKTQARHVAIGPGFDVAAMLGPDGRLAVGDPSNVPAGMYAKQALEHLGAWNAVKDRLASAENVRAALLLVERGEAPAGIVYATDAAVAPGVAVAGTFPAASHPPITYPFAVIRSGDTPEARAFMDFLHTDAVRAVFRARGFSTP